MRRKLLSLLVTLCTALGLVVALAVPAAAYATNCKSSPHTCGYPDATNTGPGSGTFTDPSVTPYGTGWFSDSTNQVVYVAGAGVTYLWLPDGWTIAVVAPNATLSHSHIKAHGNTSGITVCSLYAMQNGQANCRPSGGWPQYGYTPSTDANNFGMYLNEVIGSAPSDAHNASSALYSCVTVMNGPYNFLSAADDLSGCAPIAFQDLKGAVYVIADFMHDLNGVTGEHLQDIYVGGNTQSTTNVILVQYNTLWSDVAGGTDTSDTIGIYNDTGSDTVDNIHAMIDHNLMSVSDHVFLGGDQGTVPTYLWESNNRFTQAGPGTTPAPTGIIYSHWGGAPFTGANNNYSCGNFWDDGANGNNNGADGSVNYYDGVARSVTTCPSSPYWLLGTPVPIT